MSLYGYRWKAYRSWCRSKGVTSSSPTLPKVADFLLHLHRDKKYSASCIRGYKSLLSVMFRHVLPDLATSPVISDLLRSFELSQAPQKQPVPAWDLHKVLVGLRSPPYEPLETVDMRSLTSKVLFLVSFATAKRVGELQALSAKVLKVGRHDYGLVYLPEFRAKTEGGRLGDGASRASRERPPLPRHCVLRSLSDFVGGDAQELLLCPVRALRIYLRRLRDIPDRPRSLFVSPSKTSRAISKNAISYFIRNVILDSGAVDPEETRAPRAHSVRSASTSLAFLRNCKLSDVLEAATWRSNTTFTSFYLNVLAFNLDEVRSLGYLVAAGQVVN